MTTTLDRDLAAIAAVRSAWVQAVGDANADALRDFLADDYEVWAHGAPPIRGPQGAAAAMRDALTRFEIAQSFEPVETVVCGDWAFERGIETMILTPREGGEPRELAQRALLILRRGPDGMWRYARGMTNGLPGT
jgi:ketosteroid isomerase-like protein